MSKKYRLSSSAKSSNLKLSESEKQAITDLFQPLVEILKKQSIKENPNKQFRYLVDIYTKWYQNYIYICEKHQKERSNGEVIEFEEKLLRFKYLGSDSFDFAYFRHTGAWFVVAESISLDECKKMVLSNPVFQPMSF